MHGKNIFRHKMNSLQPSSLMVLMLSLFMASVISAHTYNRKMSNIEGDFNRLYSNVVNRNVEFMYEFELPDDFNPLVNCVVTKRSTKTLNNILFYVQLTKVQVLLVTQENTTNKYPLLATIIQTYEAIPLRLPYAIRDPDSDL